MLMHHLAVKFIAHHSSATFNTSFIQPKILYSSLSRILMNLRRMVIKVNLFYHHTSITYNLLRLDEI